MINFFGWHTRDILDHHQKIRASFSTTTDRMYSLAIESVNVRLWKTQHMMLQHHFSLTKLVNEVTADKSGGCKDKVVLASSESEPFSVSESA